MAPEREFFFFLRGIPAICDVKIFFVERQTLTQNRSRWVSRQNSQSSHQESRSKLMNACEPGGVDEGVNQGSRVGGRVGSFLLEDRLQKIICECHLPAGVVKNRHWALKA